MERSGIRPELVKRGEAGGEIYRGSSTERRSKLVRSYVIASRQTHVDSRFPTVICAPIFNRGHGASTEIPIGIDEGMKRDNWILCDNLASMRKLEMTRFVGSFSTANAQS